MEYLDYYDENDNYLGRETREVVHSEGLWHKTVHNWLYTDDGKVIFQIRKDSNKFYTTSSGHVDAGESVEEALIRETKEEIGLTVDPALSKLISVVPWKMDKVKKDGRIIKDRAKASVFITKYTGDNSDFSCDIEEVLGVVFVDAKKTLALFKGETESTEAIIVTNVNSEKRTVTIDDFLVMHGETALNKYGYILEAVIKETRL